MTLTLENIDEAKRDDLRAFAKAEKLTGYTTLKVDGLRELVRVELERREHAHAVIDKIADEYEQATGKRPTHINQGSGFEHYDDPAEDEEQVEEILLYGQPGHGRSTVFDTTLPSKPIGPPLVMHEVGHEPLPPGTYEATVVDGGRLEIAGVQATIIFVDELTKAFGTLAWRLAGFTNAYTRSDWNQVKRRQRRRSGRKAGRR